jgi:hypothetical protein
MRYPTALTEKPARLRVTVRLERAPHGLVNVGEVRRRVVFSVYIAYSRAGAGAGDGAWGGYGYGCGCGCGHVRVFSFSGSIVPIVFHFHIPNLLLVFTEKMLDIDLFKDRFIERYRGIVRNG